MQAVAENFSIIVTALLLSFALCWWGLTHYALAAKSLERTADDGSDANRSDSNSSDPKDTETDEAESTYTRVAGGRSVVRRAAGRHRAFRQAGRISAELKSMAALHTQIRQTQQARAALDAPDQTSINNARLDADSILIDDVAPPELLKPPIPVAPNSATPTMTAASGDASEASVPTSTTQTGTTKGTQTDNAISARSTSQHISERAQAAPAGSRSERDAKPRPDAANAGSGAQVAPARAAETTATVEASATAGSKTTDSGQSTHTTNNARTSAESTDTKAIDDNASAGMSDKSAAANKLNLAAAKPVHASEANKPGKVVRAPLPQTENGNAVAATNQADTNATANPQHARGTEGGDSSARTDRENTPSIAAYQLRREPLQHGQSSVPGTLPLHEKSPLHQKSPLYEKSRATQVQSGDRPNPLAGLRTPAPGVSTGDNSDKPETLPAEADSNASVTPVAADKTTQVGKHNSRDTTEERYKTAAKLMPTAPSDEAKLQVKPEDIKPVTQQTQPASAPAAESKVSGTASETSATPTAGLPAKETADTSDKVAEANTDKTSAITTANEASSNKSPTPEPSTARASIHKAPTHKAPTHKVSTSDATAESASGAAGTSVNPEAPHGTHSPGAFNDASDLENTLAQEAKDQLIKDLQAQVAALKSEQSAARSAVPENSQGDDYQQQLADTREALHLSQQKVGKLQLTLKAAQSRQSPQLPTATEVSTREPHGRPALSTKVRLLEPDIVLKETAQL